MSGIRSIHRNKIVKGSASGASAPIYVDSDDNKLKMIPAGSGTTEVDIADVSSTQTFTNKTLTAPTITTPTISLPADVKPLLTTDFTTVSSTLAAVSGWSWTVVAGTYRFMLRIPLITQTTNGGSKLAFKLTTTVLTSVNLRVKQSTDTDNTGAISTNFTTTTDVATWFDQKAVVYTYVEVWGTILVGTGGTIAVHAAQNTTHTDTTTITIGAVAELIRVN